MKNVVKSASLFNLLRNQAIYIIESHKGPYACVQRHSTMHRLRSLILSPHHHLVYQTDKIPSDPVLDQAPGCLKIQRELFDPIENILTKQFGLSPMRPALASCANLHRLQVISVTPELDLAGQIR